MRCDFVPFAILLLLSTSVGDTLVMKAFALPAPSLPDVFRRLPEPVVPVRFVAASVVCDSNPLNPELV